MTKVKEKNNLELWNKVQKTDPKYTKKVGYGRKFTSINAQYQIMQATEQFGVYGAAWGLKGTEYSYLTGLPLNQVMARADAVFFHPTGQFPISSTIMVVEWSEKKSELRIDDEWAKKVETDITTKALSKLGFSADVFLGRYDDNRYVNTMKEEFKEKVPVVKMEVTDEMKGRMEAAITAGNSPDVKRTMGKFADSPNKKAIENMMDKLDLEVQQDG